MAYTDDELMDHVPVSLYLFMRNRPHFHLKSPNYSCKNSALLTFVLLWIITKEPSCVWGFAFPQFWLLDGDNSLPSLSSILQVISANSYTLPELRISPFAHCSVLIARATWWTSDTKGGLNNSQLGGKKAALIHPLRASILQVISAISYFLLDNRIACLLTDPC